MLSFFSFPKTSCTIVPLRKKTKPVVDMTERQKKWIAALGVAVFVLLSLLVFWFVGKPLVRYLSEPERFRSWVDTHGLWGRAVFLAMTVLQVFVAIIPGEPLEICAGYAFGAVEGTLLCVVGMALGQVLVFLFVRKFGVHAVEVFVSQEKIASMAFLQKTRRVYLFFIIAFLLPGTPKDVLSYLVGLTPIPMGQWILVSSICRLPSVVTSTLGGDALGEGAVVRAAIVFAITICISVLGLLLYRHLCQKRNTE